MHIIWTHSLEQIILMCSLIHAEAIFSHDFAFNRYSGALIQRHGILLTISKIPKWPVQSGLSILALINFEKVETNAKKIT